MRFDVLTLFPNLFDTVFSESIVRRAVDAGQVEIGVYNIRDYAPGKHQVTDDTPYGGGGGMVMKAEPIILALEAILGITYPRPADDDPDVASEAPEPANTPRIVTADAPRVVLLTPRGKLFNQAMARDFERSGHIVFLCGRYEGIDERVSELAVTDEVSVGDYVLSGGEIPAMLIIEAVTRLVPGVLGDMRAVIDDSHSTGLLEYPHYTRPYNFRGLTVPDILLSGHHANVQRWRRDQSLRCTRERRPELLDHAELSKLDRRFLERLEQEEQEGDEDGMA